MGFMHQARATLVFMPRDRENVDSVGGVFRIGVFSSIWGRPEVLEELKGGTEEARFFLVSEDLGEGERAGDVRMDAVLIGEADLARMDEGWLRRKRGELRGVPWLLLGEEVAMERVVDWINSGWIDRILFRPWAGCRVQGLVREWFGGIQMGVGSSEGMRRLDTELAELRGTLALQKEHFLGFCFRVLHAFDPLSAVRTELVVDICRAMAQCRSFDPREREALRTASWLFDVGLVSVPRALLHRLREGSERVDSEELELFRHHPVIGQTLAAFVDPLRSVGEVIRAHHERFDGSGFPDGLAGDRIPWPARCLGVAVAYVESDLPALEAAERIQEGSGEVFDPEAVRLFFKAHPVSKLPRNVREVLMGELEEGMQLAKGITTRSGVLLVPAGQELNAVSVSKLRNHARLNLVTERILVFR